MQLLPADRLKNFFFDLQKNLQGLLFIRAFMSIFLYTWKIILTFRLIEEWEAWFMRKCYWGFLIDRRNWAWNWVYMFILGLANYTKSRAYGATIYEEIPKGQKIKVFVDSLICFVNEKASSLYKMSSNFFSEFWSSKFVLFWSIWQFYFRAITQNVSLTSRDVVNFANFK